MPHITIFALIVSIVLAPVSVSAQVLQQSDMNAVLQAIQDLRKEIKVLRDDVAALKRKSQGGQKPASTTTENLQVSVDSKPKQAMAPKTVAGRMEYGWIVWAYDFPCCWNVNFNTEPLGGFPFMKTKFDTKMHEKSVPTSNNVAYKAEGFFSAPENGKYTFTVSFGETFTCGAGLEIDSTPVIAFKVESRSAGQTLQGSKDLNAAEAKITLYYACNSGDKTPKTIKLLVRGPGDLLPREVSINEISHKVRG